MFFEKMIRTGQEQKMKYCESRLSVELQNPFLNI